ncbi:MAG: MinD/ParA family protein [Gammaproteobacteria bacterium]|nr:MinD/ParA family protein [Gammaproteobacteria bacterium]
MANEATQTVDPGGTRVFAVTSGKGGVGKTTVSINLAVALAAAGRRVTLLDADLGLANIDVLLGLTPTRTLLHVLDGQCSLDEIMLEGPAGVRVIPATSGVQRMADLTNRERAGLLYAFSQLQTPPDIMIVDTAAGIAANSLQFCEASQEVIVVVCNDPASITDAYATIKVLNQRTRRLRFRVLINMVHSNSEALDLFNRLLCVTERFLDVTLDLAGTIPYDQNVAMAVRRRSACVAEYPRSAASQAFKNLASTADKWPKPPSASGQLEFFLERIIQSDVIGRHAQA